MKKLKPIPKFKNEKEEAKFWDTHDTTEYFDMSKPLRLVFPNLHLSTKLVTIRLPVSLVANLKILANKKDVLCNRSQTPQCPLVAAQTSQANG